MSKRIQALQEVLRLAQGQVEEVVDYEEIAERLYSVEVFEDFLTSLEQGQSNEKAPLLVLHKVRELAIQGFERERQQDDLDFDEARCLCSLLHLDAFIADQDPEGRR